MSLWLLVRNNRRVGRRTRWWIRQVETLLWDKLIKTKKISSFSGDFSYLFCAITYFHHVRTKNFGDGYWTIFVLVVFRIAATVRPTASPEPLRVWRSFTFTIGFVTVTDLCTTGLKSSVFEHEEIRGKYFVLEPNFQVVSFRSWESHIASFQSDDTVWGKLSFEEGFQR